ncbi:phosphate/phosphite/phosphonate ABC transporter substrate-binding protein [Vibrio aquaticus]|uniref:Phosphate/phosphite/phosphonate ABC transporter substrate-binding protein n=1 Tax=Vibrio aquaticus TaxID=2496559 RepID=A0A432CZQ5_9VIBR|nr:phosphate/phosphite/phosphonate ABC transporter substrate-binding protein [Vibrio aquaticus]RTZ16808.1 phosphate/phosphite/phosphonate ABC transporter substrate-binding protein [Vibrio aquaticus]
MKKFIAASLLLISLPSMSTETLTFGIVPQQSASRLAQHWGPLMEYLSEETQLNIEFSTAADIPTFERRLANGEYDLAYMNPYHYTVFSQKSGYQALAKAKNKQIKGILVTQKGRKSNDLQQFDGETLAFPSPAAFAATLLTQSDLNLAGVTYQANYVSSHDSVYLAVAKGLYPAGGGVMRTFNAIPQSLRDQLEPVWVTQPYTPHAIAYHSNIEPSKRQPILEALERLDSTEEGQVILERLKIRGFIQAQDSDWDDVRQLNIQVLK